MKKAAIFVVVLIALSAYAFAAGFDEFGYNYQAQSFNGRYCDFDRVLGGAFCDVHLSMKWSYDWLNPERQRGCDRKTGICSGTSTGWITNHMRANYEQGGKECKWEWFVKIVYMPNQANCVAIGGVPLWGAYCEIESIYNDPCAGAHGPEVLVQPAGFGAYK